MTITAIDIDGDPQFFDQKYRDLPTPNDHNGTPDLQGKDNNGVIHLGEAEIDVNDSNVEEQLKAFSSRTMKGTNTPVPLHVIVQKKLETPWNLKFAKLD